MSKKVLWVEDDDQLRVTSAMLMKYAGFEVTSVSSGEEAIRQLKAETYDIVLSDVLLGSFSGIELAEFMKSQFPETPILLCSAYVGNDEPEMSSYALLQKPFSYPKLTSMLNDMILQARSTS